MLSERRHRVYTTARLFFSPPTLLNSKNTYYAKSGSANAVKNATVKIASITVPDGVYMVYAINGVNSSSEGMMNAAIMVTENARILTGNARTISSNGGGAVTFGLVTASGQTTISSIGYGYNDGTYNYESTIVAIRL